MTPPQSTSGHRDQRREGRSAPAEPSAKPLTPAVFHVLLALADGPRHGYAIMSNVRDNVEGGRRVGPGTIYGTLQRLEDVGLVQALPSDGRRRSFELLPAGRTALEAEALRLTRLAELVRDRRVLPEEG
ncbi:MAG TPA: PadR family transcriptional regulator [Thermoanaerobaculia bacterium]|nr:PadR family transcriptional regulator [Thermoanaerobaculia bacterium]